MHEFISRALIVHATLVTFAVAPAAAQRIIVGGGVNVGAVPRALEPLCASARRLGGVGLSGYAGVAVRSVHVGASIDYVARVGVRDAAGCVQRSGISVDSSFAEAGNSAAILGVNAWVPIGSVLRIGAETGRVLNHSSWFMGPAVGARYRNVQFEVIARRHVTTFEEVTREYGSSIVREISRISRSERSWGAAGRLLLITH